LWNELALLLLKDYFVLESISSLFKYQHHKAATVLLDAFPAPCGGWVLDDGCSRQAPALALGSWPGPRELLSPGSPSALYTLCSSAALPQFLVLRSYICFAVITKLKCGKVTNSNNKLPSWP